MKVLIADDSRLMRERIRAILSDASGIDTIHEAEDSPTAIQAVKKTKPDVVILDICMPGGNGISALEAIKSTADPPITIMLTNYPYPQYRKKCIDLGADFFLDKSSEFDALTDIFHALMFHQDKKE